MWPLLHHDEEANCQDTQASHYQSIPIRFPLYHCTAALSQSEAPVTQKGKILLVQFQGLKVRVEKTQLEFHSAAYYSLQTACPGQVYNCRCVLVPGKSPCLKLLAKWVSQLCLGTEIKSTFMFASIRNYFKYVDIYILCLSGINFF